MRLTVSYMNYHAFCAECEAYENALDLVCRMSKSSYR